VKKAKDLKSFRE